ncbi:diguanylate cyclase [Azoarcus sp. L1K30]|uniref:GGDEF domain-containing protein n=1 Tax=Azoarcus sp. L1K30 TaxID=2820277 RepID=UPI001B82D30F|nr:GGDEF domain-containing protein [Azoarcus sp. L1K30]MBR0565093.1 diguanylate cyclase [Azoarcus sp. L1K30]
MTLRLKLGLSFLLVGLVSASAVGGAAWWMLMRDFQASVEEKAFKNFRGDVEAYVTQFGSWEAAERVYAFPDFVRQRHLPRAPLSAAEQPDDERPGSPRRRRPPFKFTLIHADGRVIQAAEGVARGQIAPPEWRKNAYPIKIDGKVALYAIPLGRAELSADDRIYLGLMRRALFVGLAVAVVVAAAFGFVFGNRLAASLGELTKAIRGLRTDGELPESLPVRSKDEIGQLAEAFNHMGQSLSDAHRELRTSNETILAQSEQLREQARRDHLTALHNRRYLDEQGQTMYAHTVRHHRPMCVMLTDLDHFKRINDQYSHGTGDEVLKRVAQILENNVRSSDLVARYGGEEFAAIFAESSLAQARERCETLRRMVENEPWEDLAPGLKVTLSIGLCDNLALGSLSAMLSEADDQLYRAKDNGRNRVEPGVVNCVVQADVAVPE